MNETAKTRIATHIEIAWGEGLSAPVTCPNCGAHGPAQALLGIDYTPPGKHYRFNLLVCPACAVRFTDNAESMDYGTDELIELGWLVYQVQLGAGVWPISSPLTRVPKPPGATMLEIGGAFGFGLDFGARAAGAAWGTIPRRWPPSAPLSWGWISGRLISPRPRWRTGHGMSPSPPR